MSTSFLVVCVLGLLATVVVASAQRIALGADWRDLVADQFRELISLRAMLWMGLGLAWAANALTLATVVIKGLGLFSSDSRGGTAGAFFLGAILAWPAWKSRKWLHLKLHKAPLIPPPAVNFASGVTNSGIAPDEMLRLGAERFPNHISPQRQEDRWIRWCLLLGCTIVALLLFGSVDSARSAARFTAVRTPGEIRQIIGMVLAYPSAVALLILLVSNRDYTLVPFRISLVVQAGLSLLVLVGAAMVAVPPGSVHRIGMVVFAFMAWRSAADLLVERRYGKMKRTLDPIVSDIRQQLPAFDGYTEEPSFCQPALNSVTLESRLAQGCRNVEEKGPLVTRHFARFFTIADVATRDCMMAQLRFLTVRRYVTLSSGVGTYASLRHPKVPVWNESLFPVSPPEGYVNCTDPLLLGSEWQAVLTCGRCGGTGQILENYQEYSTEYYTDSDGRSQTRTVSVTKQRWVVCPCCGGSGRLLHSQILHTQWQRMQPTLTTPEMMLSELVEDAEEVTFLELPVKENRQLLPSEVQFHVDQEGSARSLARAAQALAQKHFEHAAAIEHLHDGIVYRADFRVCGFKSIRMRFQNLAGREGWFFGNRPEFYFPRLPVSWEAVATAIFLPPVALSLATMVLGIAGKIFGDR